MQVEDPVVILGFGPQGQMLANMLASPLAQSGNKTRTYIGFDLDHTRVTASRRAGFNVAYGNGARPGVLKAAGAQCTCWLALQARCCFTCCGEPRCASMRPCAAYKSVQRTAVTFLSRFWLSMLWQQTVAGGYVMYMATCMLARATEGWSCDAIRQSLPSLLLLLLQV
jgi:hypothetical protein